MRSKLGIVAVGLGLILTSFGPALGRADVPIPAQLPALAPTAAFDPVVEADIAEKGYHIGEINDGVYWVTDGNHQAMVVVSSQGVILVDAPEPLPFFAPTPVLDAIAEVTDKPVTHMIYSHAHTDHIGGAGVVKAAFPDVEIIAHEETKKLLLAAADPKRPVPDRTFRRRMKLRVGEKRLELSYLGNTHLEGNIFIHAPDQKVLMAIDIVFPGWVPFRRLGLSNDIPGWIAGQDQILGFPFETLIAGHSTRLGTREDVFAQKAYVDDIVASVEAADMDALLDAKYIEGPHPGDDPLALGGAEAFNFSTCEAYFVVRRLGVQH